MANWAQIHKQSLVVIAKQRPLMLSELQEKPALSCLPSDVWANPYKGTPRLVSQSVGWRPDPASQGSAAISSFASSRANQWLHSDQSGHLFWASAFLWGFRVLVKTGQSRNGDRHSYLWKADSPLSWWSMPSVSTEGCISLAGAVTLEQSEAVTPGLPRLAA